MTGNDDDGDGSDDGCDVCPFGGAGAADVDGDGDGVGDGCDPSPGGDRLAVFDPFTGDTLDPRWRVTAGVALTNSRLEFIGSGATAAGYLADPSRSAASFRGTLTRVGTSTERQISIQFGEATAPDADYCEVFGTAPRFKLSRLTASGFEELAALDLAAVGAGPVAMELRATATSISCTAIIPPSTQPVTLTVARPLAKAWTFIYMQMIDTDAAIDNYAEVVSR